MAATNHWLEALRKLVTIERKPAWNSSEYENALEARMAYMITHESVHYTKGNTSKTRTINQAD